jgi:hypothetical protein
LAWRHASRMTRFAGRGSLKGPLVGHPRPPPGHAPGKSESRGAVARVPEGEGGVGPGRSGRHLQVIAVESES